MSGKVFQVIGYVWLVLTATACVESATDEEIASMCDNLVHLRGKISPPSTETLVSDVTVKFEQEAKEINEKQMRERKALDEERRVKLETAKNEMERSKVEEEYAEKIDALGTKYAPKIVAANSQKSEALVGAKKKGEENRAAWDEAVNACIAQAKKEKVSQKIAHCRIKAKSADKYWNGCR
jgi:polyhydroxyalkanoate synthesis regulator phasin